MTNCNWKVSFICVLIPVLDHESHTVLEWSRITKKDVVNKKTVHKMTFQEQEMFPQYYMHSDQCNKFKSLNTHCCVSETRKG